MGLTREQRKQREAAKAQREAVEAQKRRDEAWKWLVMLDDALRPVPLPKPEKFGVEATGWVARVPSSWWNRGVDAEQRWQTPIAEYSSPPGGSKYRSGSRTLNDLYATKTEALLAGCYMLKDLLCEHIATTLERMEGK